MRFVRERNGSRNVIDGTSRRNPPGFETAAAIVVMSGGRERIRLMDATGALAAQFDCEQQPGRAALRVGRGKLTVVLEPANNPRVRYWHPEREFKWSRKGGWQFITPVTERSIDVDDSGTRWSNDGRSSSSTLGTAAAVAGAAALVSGAGGAFAGGGASDQWDSPAGAGDGADATATSYCAAAGGEHGVCRKRASVTAVDRIARLVPDLVPLADEREALRVVIA